MSRTCYFCSGVASGTTALSWWLNSWTLPVTADKKIVGLDVWLADTAGIAAYMAGTQAETDAAKGMFSPFIESCGSSYSLKRHYKG